MLTLAEGDQIDRDEVLEKLVEMLYERNYIDPKRVTFRVKGDIIEVIPVNQHTQGVRIEFFDDVIDRITLFDIVTGVVSENKKTISLFPASHFVTSDEKLEKAIVNIEKELEERLEYFK